MPSPQTDPFRLSKQAFQVLAERSPDSPRTRQVLGEARAAGGNPVAAEEHFRAALSLRPDLRGVHFELGEMYLDSGDYEKAEREFREEARLAPGFAPAAHKLGVVLMNRGETRARLRNCGERTGCSRTYPRRCWNWARPQPRLERRARRKKLFRRVLDQEQTSILAESAHFQLAQIYRKQGRIPDADREMKLFQEMRARQI
jgi:tetratricopeptide (TPR) repeat protein